MLTIVRVQLESLCEHMVRTSSTPKDFSQTSLVRNLQVLFLAGLNLKCWDMRDLRKRWSVPYLQEPQRNKWSTIYVGVKLQCAIIHQFIRKFSYLLTRKLVNQIPFLFGIMNATHPKPLFLCKRIRVINFFPLSGTTAKYFILFILKCQSFHLCKYSNYLLEMLIEHSITLTINHLGKGITSY